MPVVLEGMDELFGRTVKPVLMEKRQRGFDGFGMNKLRIDSDKLFFYVLIADAVLLEALI